MPIKPENLNRYPANWRQVREKILARAGNRCERCGLPNGVIGYREKGGAFMPLARKGFRVDYIQSLHPDKRVFQIVLTVAHLDHVPENCKPKNLKALCQKCHLRHDAAQHARSAWLTRHAHKRNLELFGEPA
jgi:ribosomal protein S14